MKITKTRLKQIIKEEINNVVSEEDKPAPEVALADMAAKKMKPAEIIIKNIDDPEEVKQFLVKILNMVYELSPNDYTKSERVRTLIDFRKTIPDLLKQLGRKSPEQPES
jgi:hypothetical protein